MDNQFYVGMLEGRFPITIDTHIAADDPDMFEATFTDSRGTSLTTRSLSQADAHNRCTDLVREAVREGTIVPMR
jgi:hypothetical protein